MFYYLRQSIYVKPTKELNVFSGKNHHPLLGILSAKYHQFNSSWGASGHVEPGSAAWRCWHQDTILVRTAPSIWSHSKFKSKIFLFIPFVFLFSDVFVCLWFYHFSFLHKGTKHHYIQHGHVFALMCRTWLVLWWVAVSNTVIFHLSLNHFYTVVFNNCNFSSVLCEK